MSTPIAIFRPGRHCPALDAAALRRSAAAYDPKLHEAPLVVGHPANNAPAYGWVSALSFDEPQSTLLAAPKQVAGEFAEAVRAGRFKKISSSFYLPNAPQNPVQGSYYLRHVGFLGAAAPAVKGLPAVEFSDDEASILTVEFADEPSAISPWTLRQLATLPFEMPVIDVNVHISPWTLRQLATLLRGLREWILKDKGADVADSMLPGHYIDDLVSESERMNAVRKQPQNYIEETGYA